MHSYGRSLWDSGGEGWCFATPSFSPRTLSEQPPWSSQLGGEAAEALRTLESAVDEAADGPLGELDLADREEAIQAWLAAHAIDESLAYALATANLIVANLDEAVAALGQRDLSVVLQFLAARTEALQLANEIVGAAGRVYSLVDAVKKHTHMDRAPVVESIPLGDHLEGTLTLVGGKARARSITLELSLEPELPNVDGVVGDLNHVWINLVDNAIDAVGESGQVAVTARRDGDSIVVDVTDDGPGIAAKDRDRVFDPFFTTKGVGEGVGLGLDVVRTIVESHNGSVNVSSESGRTRFSVRLPAATATGSR